MKKVKCVLFLIFFFFQYYLKAQNQFIEKIIPPIPEVANLLKYEEIPVDYNTGVPNINIPLTNISSRKLNTNISLSYHASGIKVNEIPSWVGLGWSLQGIWVINRQVNGLADEHQNGYFGNSFNNQSNNGQFSQTFTLINPNLKNVDADKLAGGLIDTEPDLYTFTLPEGSGKFVMTTDKKVQISPYKNWQIKFENFPNSFTIITETGTQYLFDSVIENNYYGTTCGSIGWLQNYFYNQSWYISKITAANGLDYIKYNYINKTITGDITYNWSNDYKLYQGSPISDADNSCYYIPTYKSKQLTSIETTDTKVEFIPNNTVREDLPTDQALSEIRVYYNNQIVKSYAFSYSYFVATGSVIGYPHLSKRLKLTQVQEKNKEGLLLPGHQFEYYEDTPLPFRSSPAQDKWGFYNGKLTNTSKIPKMTVYWPTNSGYQELPGDDKSIDPTALYTRANSLKKIIYPTKGSSTFEFEPNNYTTRQKISNAQPDIYDIVEYDYFKKFFDCLEEETITKTTSVRAFSTDLTFKQSTINIPKKQILIINWGFNGYQGNTTEQPGSTRKKEIKIIKLVNGVPIVNPVFFKDQSSSNMSGIEYLLIDSGDYVISAQCDLTRDQPPYSTNESTIYMNLKWFENNPSAILAGGLRIKQISVLDDINNLPKVKKYSYQKQNNSTSSSGILKEYPYFSHISMSKAIDWGITMPGILSSSDIIYLCAELKISGNPKSGREVNGYSYYTEVKVIEGDNNQNGYVIYEYIEPFLPPSHLKAPQVYPFCYVSDYSWLDGLLKKESYFDNNNKLLQDTEYTYDFSVYSPNTIPPINSSKPVGVKHDYLFYEYEVGGQLYTKFLAYYQKINYFPSGYNRLTSKISKQYNRSDNNFIKTEETYTYRVSEPLQIMQKSSKDSKNNEHIIKYKYPLDYINCGDYNTNISNFNIYVENCEYGPLYSCIATAQTTLNQANSSLNTCLDSKINDLNVNMRERAIHFMYRNGLYNIPLEESTWIKPDNGLELLISSKRTDFSIIQGVTIDKPNFIVPTSIWLTQLNQPILNGNPMDTYRNEWNYLYDNQDNLISQFKESDILTTYLWAYNNTYPIAQVINAASTQIYHTSFEEETTGVTSTGAKTGGKYWNTASYTIPSAKQPTNTANLVMTYWWLDASNVWQFQSETAYSSTISKSGAIGLDEIRVYPKGAQMSTYTYAPLIGMTSQTDVNNQSMYYEYDGFGRLILIKDYQGKILKQQIYHYKGE